MKWLPRRDRATTQRKKADVDAQAHEAKQAYEQTQRDKRRVEEVLAMFFHHAEKNQIIENLHKVARGHG